MSLPPGTSCGRVALGVVPGVGERRRCTRGSARSAPGRVPPGVSGLAHASWVLALLPTVVSVGVPPAAMVSHGPGAATLRRAPVGSVQPAAGNQQPIDGVARGRRLPGEVSDGLAGKKRHFGLSSRRCPAPRRPSLVRRPQPRRCPAVANGTVGASNGQTCSRVGARPGSSAGLVGRGLRAGAECRRRRAGCRCGSKSLTTMSLTGIAVAAPTIVLVVLSVSVERGASGRSVGGA